MRQGVTSGGAGCLAARVCTSLVFFLAFVLLLVLLVLLVLVIIHFAKVKGLPVLACLEGLAQGRAVGIESLAVAVWLFTIRSLFRLIILSIYLFLLLIHRYYLCALLLCLFLAPSWFAFLRFFLRDLLFLA